MLAHLQSLTWRFRADGRTVWAIAPYSEPVIQASGTNVYRPRRAAETGEEGWACVDDGARAALLALTLAERSRMSRAVSATIAPIARSATMWARRWLTFVRYMQLPDGQFANFVVDASGQRNLRGPTSVPGGVWWTGRALWALARYHQLTRSRWALEAWLRCPLPDPSASGKTLGLFVLAACELLRADPTVLDAQSEKRLSAEQLRLRQLVLDWTETIIHRGSAYFADIQEHTDLSLWGYHQLHAVATAAGMLHRTDWISHCATTVQNLIEPVIAARGVYTWDPEHGHSKAGLCAYCLSPLVQGLGALYELTHDAHYRLLAREAADWLYGRNDAHAQLYDATTGRCSDGLDGPEASIPSTNYGAESAIEAGFMEVERLALAKSNA